MGDAPEPTLCELQILMIFGQRGPFTIHDGLHGLPIAQAQQPLTFFEKRR
jgi:hypothetical protein